MTKRTKTLDLASLFKTLSRPEPSSEDGMSFTALPVPGYEAHRLGCDQDGRPVLLIAVTEEAPSPPPIALEHLAVQHDIRCRVVAADGSVDEGFFTVIRTVGTDRVLNAHFLRVTGGLVAALGRTPSREDVAQVIGRLTELFRALTLPARKSVQGLWAELFVMARSRNPAALAAAWHVSPDDRFDYCAGEQRIEVKSAADRVRRHHFALEQVHPPSGTKVLIASLFVERAGVGTSVAELLDQVHSQIGQDANLLLHVDQMTSLTLGQEWRHGLVERFDYQLARDSLAFFEPSTIPSVYPDLPPGVSDVRFRSDLSGSETADIAAYRERGGIFRAALAR